VPDKKPEKITLPIVFTIIAPPKTGKTYYACTCPERVVIYSFDLGAKIVVARPEFKGKDIVVREYPLPIVDSVQGKGQQEDIKTVWDAFSKDYQKDIADPKVNTLVIDTGTHLYEIARIARSKELGQTNLLQHQYGDVYARIRALIQRARLANKSLVITHHVRDKYVDDKNTGEVEQDGCKIIPGEADVVMWLTKKTTKVEGRMRVVTTARISDSRWREIEGMEFDNPSYDDILAMLGL
jgi:hypothetical protein